MTICLRSGMEIETSMKHGDFEDLMRDDAFDFIIVPDIHNELKLYNIRKEAIDVLVIR